MDFIGNQTVHIRFFFEATWVRFASHILLNPLGPKVFLESLKCFDMP